MQLIINREGYIFGTRKKKYGLISKHPVYEDGKVIGVLCQIVDITKQKELEFIQQLIIDAVNRADAIVGIYDLDEKKFIHTTNAGPNIFGNYPDLRGHELFDNWLNKIVHPDDREEQKRIVENFDLLPEERTYRIIHPQKGVRTIKAIALKMSSLFNRRFIVSISLDITDKKDEVNETNGKAGKA